MESLILTMSHWVQWTTCLLPVTRDPGSNPWGDLCKTRILLLALSRYIGGADVIDHFCGLILGGVCPEPSLGPRTDSVIIPLDLTQLFCLVSRRLQVPFPASQPTESAAGVEPCGEPHSHHASLVQWTTCLLGVTRDPGSEPLGGTYVKPGFSWGLV